MNAIDASDQPIVTGLSLDCTQFEQLVGLMELVLTTREGINKESAFQFMPWTLEIEEGHEVAIDRADEHDLRVFYRWNDGDWFVHKPSTDDAIEKLTAIRQELEALPEDQFITEAEAAKQLGVTVDDLRKSRGESR